MDYIPALIMVTCAIGALLFVCRLNKVHFIGSVTVSINFAGYFVAASTSYTSYLFFPGSQREAPQYIAPSV